MVEIKFEKKCIITADTNLLKMVYVEILPNFENYFWNITISILKRTSVTIPTIVDLGQKVRSNLISVVQFFVLILNLASDLPYVAYFGGKSTSKFGLPALF